jgi:anthranilate phosphoribosyltransferase
MSPEEHAAAVEAIVARRDEEGDYQAAALATAIAYRIDQRIRQIDRDMAAARMRLTYGQRRRHLRVVA